MEFKDIMAFNSPYNQLNFNNLIENIKSKKIVPYIGAGMSMLFDNVYPSWNGFLSSTFDQYLENEDKIKYDSLSYEEKADFLCSEMGRITFGDHLKDIFGENHLDREEIDFRDKSVYLLPLIFQNGLLITTNYDKVIEKIYGLHGKTPTVAHPGHYEALNRAIRDGALLLYKIHGDIAEPETSIILSKEQYDKAYDNKDLIQSLHQTFISKEMLFLGCSVTKDRPIEFLCNISSSGMRNYAIVPCEKDNVKSRRLELENEYFTKGIIYPEGKHECLKVLLDCIANEVNPQGYQQIMSKYYNNKSNSICIELTDEWFIEQNQIQIKNMGDRYLPDLNVELGIKKVFDALGRNECFYKVLLNKSDKLLIALTELKLNCIKENIDRIHDIISNYNNDSIELLRVDDIFLEADSIFEEIDKKISENYEKLNDDSSENNSKIENDIDSLNTSHTLLYEYITYLESNEVSTANNPYILLYGEGGIGKSHIIADTIMKRKLNGKKSILFLGQHFKEEQNPFIDILKFLELDCSSEQFLSELNKKAKEDNSRIIFFIDALNEGNGKKIWKDYLPGLVQKLKLYPWLGLVVSIRTEYLDVLFNNNSSLEKEFVKIKHQGFSSLEYDAIKKYFDFYNIQFTDIPFAEQEFRNPLFLRLLCEGFKNSNIDLSQISFTDVYKNYLLSINLRISEKCEYSRHINIVEKVINEMVLYKHRIGLGNNFIPIEDAVDMIVEIERKFNIKKSLLDELLSSGVITQNINNNNEECVYVTYEKLDDYLYAKLVANDLNEIGIDQFRIRYKKLLAYGDIIEALAIVLAENNKYELFEIFDEEKCNKNIIRSFCSSLKWRKPDEIYQKTINYINEVVLRTHNGFERLIDTLMLISTKVGHSLNAERTVDYILSYPMPNRDAKFIPLFDNLFGEESSSINRLLDWCLSDNNKNTLEETARLTAITIATFLISPNNTLRDKTTKALVNLLKGKIDVLISVLEKYKDVDDSYITERLYAVALGCVVSEQNNDEIKKVALYVYKYIFEEEYVYPNMLLRDYAKSIIEYAKCRVASGVLLSLDVTPPYKSQMPEIPTDEEIKEYKFDYNSPDFEDYYWSQNSILNSMKVEYSRDGSPGGYGDFGRYTFQSYFSNWKGLDYVDLKNIAIKKIFDMGYDVEKHGRYDRKIDSMRFRDDSRERIGKKYQWIALYELAAQVADKYKMEIHSNCYGDKEQVYCKGAYEPNLRNIDPTALNLIDDTKRREIHENLFQFTSMTNHRWLENFDDLPELHNLVKLNYRNEDYVLLNGWYIWTDEKKLGEKKYQYPKKDMWVQVNAYIVKENMYDEVINKLKGRDFIGRWLAEPNENYDLFNKEYYWSDAYRFYKNTYYCGDDWTEIAKYNEKGLSELEVLIPSCKYVTERKGDAVNSKGSSTWHKPCMEMFDALDMKYGRENSVLYDKNGEIVCFDSGELLNEDIGFFIKSKLFSKFLIENNYKVFWTLLAEKRIISGSHNSRDKYKQPRISGILTIDCNGKINAEISKFED
jgi:hypothetical protein